MQNFFFFPDRVNYGSPEQQGMAFENVYFNSADGTLLNGWFIAALESAPDKAKGTVVHMHGNAQNMSAHWMFAGWLPAQGYNLLVFDYRGYGQSQGVPDEKGVFEDSVAALNYLQGRPDIDVGKLLVFGQSLGGMLAITAAATHIAGVCGVVAEAPAYSYEEWAFDQMPELQLPTDDTYTAANYIKDWPAQLPLLLIHGTADKVVPHSHSQRLLQELGAVAQLVAIEGGGHNEAMTDRHGVKYRQRMLEFFNTLI